MMTHQPQKVDDFNLATHGMSPMISPEALNSLNMKAKKYDASQLVASQQVSPMYLQHYSSKLAHILSDARSRVSQSDRSPGQLLSKSGIDAANQGSLLPQSKGLAMKIEKLKRKEAK